MYGNGLTKLILINMWMEVLIIFCIFELFINFYNLITLNFFINFFVALHTFLEPIPSIVMCAQLTSRIFLTLLPSFV